MGCSKGVMTYIQYYHIIQNSFPALKVLCAPPFISPSSQTLEITDLFIISMLFLFSHWVMSDSLQPHGLQHAKFPCPSLSPQICSNSCPLSQWCYLTFSSSAAPPPFAFNLSQHQGLFQWIGSSHQLAKVLELQLQHQSFQWVFRVDFLSDWLAWTSCSSRDSQESSPAPQFESISSLVLSLRYGPAFTSVHGYWKYHIFDYTFVGKVMSLLLNTLSRFVIAFLTRSKHLPGYSLQWF